MDNNEIDPTMIDKLILDGAIEFRGIDEDGKFLYGFTENAKTVAPETYNNFVEGFYKHIIGLWEMGFLNMDITKENPLVMPTQKAFNKDAVALLPIHMQKALTFMIEAMKQ
jgi:hypothetical protein